MSDTKNTSLSPDAIRLECLRLAHRNDKDAQSVVDRATEYERFVLGSDPPAATAPPLTDKATAKPRSKSS